jgi:hypothetical protein
MEMDPNSAAFQRIFSNVFAYTAFKSTEPWLVDYVTLDLHDAMKQVSTQTWGLGVDLCMAWEEGSYGGAGVTV